MGFRNPITTAIDPTARQDAHNAQVDAATALTQIIPGSRLAADAIDGKTITGATISGASIIGSLIRATGTGDANPTSVGHALQAGPTSGPNVAIDGNEVLARINGAAAPLFFTSPRSLPESEDLATAPANAIVTKSFIGSVIGFVEPTAAHPSWATGWTVWNDGIYHDLQFTLTRDEQVTVSGLAKYTGATGATTKIFAISGSYVPRGLRHILDGSVQDTPRTFEVRADGLYLRGALPTAGQFVSINGTYPAVNATT